MAGEAQRKALVNVRRAQSRLERAKGALGEASYDRRESFLKARAAGLSLAEIAEAANLHRSRVDQILRGE